MHKLFYFLVGLLIGATFVLQYVTVRLLKEENASLAQFALNQTLKASDMEEAYNACVDAKQSQKFMVVPE